jgi:3-isopropylmalate dehydrogenase
MAAILSAALMCRWLGQHNGDAAATRAGERIDAAVAAALTDARARPRDIGGTASTREAADAVIKAL